MAQVVADQRWRCLTYCLMTNHYHLLIQLQAPNLSEGMRRLNGEFACMFNERHERVGHLFERRFWSEVVVRDSHLLTLARYIALNPVRANLCRTARDWPWSAHRALLGDRPREFVDVNAILGYFDANPEIAVRRYANFVNDEVADTAIDPELVALLAQPDRDQAIARAHVELGYTIHAIADAIGCHPKTIRRRLAAVVPKGV